MEKIEDWENRLEKVLISPKEKDLLDLVITGKNDKEKIENITRDLKFSEVPYNNLLLMSCIGYNSNWKFFPKDAVSMLKGIHKYYQVYNVMYIPWFVQELNKIKKNNIDVMVCDESAMCLYYDKNFPRDLNFFSIVVRKRDLSQVLELLVKDESEIDEKNKLTNLIVKSYLSEDDVEDKKIWDRAIKYNFQGVDVYIPKEEDMFASYIEKLSQNILLTISVEKRLRGFYDCFCIYKNSKEFDKKIVLERLNESKDVNRVHMILSIFARLFPNTFTDKEIKESFTCDKKYYETVKNAVIYGEKLDKYKTFLNTPYRKILPLHAFRSINLFFKEWKYIGPELKSRNENITKWEWFLRSKGLYNSKILNKK